MQQFDIFDNEINPSTSKKDSPAFLTLYARMYSISLDDRLTVLVVTTRNRKLVSK